MDPITGFMMGMRLYQLGWDTVRRLKTWNEYTPLKPVAIGNFGLPMPRLDGSVAVPIVWGRDRVRQPLIVWAGNPNTSGVTQDINGDPITVAQKYRLDMSFCVGIPGGQGSPTLIPASSPGVMRKLWIGEKPVAAGASQATDRHQIDEPDLLGGPTAGGGISAVMIWYPGTFQQNKQPEITAAWDENGDDSDLLSAYRGFMMLHLLTFVVGEDPHLEPLSVEVECPTKLDFAGANPFPTVLGKIGDGDANPANVIYDLYTNPWGRMGRPASELDLDALYAAGLVLAQEQNGWTMTLSDQRDAGDVLEEILRQIDGFMYVEPTTNKLTLKLVRNDYDVGTLPVLNDSNVIKVAGYQSATWEGTYNEFCGTFLDRKNNYEPGSAHDHDAANFAVQGNVARLLTVDWPGCRTQALANKLTARLRRQFSLPLVKVRLVVNRDGYTLRPGSVFKWTRSRWNITNKVMRVLDVNLGDGRDSTVTIDAIEDRFTYDSVGVPDWDPVFPPNPKPVIERIAEEAPRWLAVRAASSGIVADVDQPHALYLAVARANTTRYQGLIKAAEAGQFDEADTGNYSDDTPVLTFPPTFQVDTEYSRTLDPYDTATGLVIKNLVGWTPASATSTLIKIYGRNLIRVADEWMAYESATDLGSGRWRLNNVWRGLLDTVPVKHLVNERGYAPYNSFGFHRTRIGLNELPYPSSVGVRWRVFNLGSLTPTDPLFIDEFDIGLRALAPYPVADLKLDNSKAPAALEEDGIDLTWKRRDRTKTAITRGDAAAETPDAGTTYETWSVKDGVEKALDGGGAFTGDAASNVHMGSAGYGAIDVIVKSRRTVTLADGSSVALYSWQDPTIAIVAEEWRNLLINPRFADGLTEWTVASGTPTTVTGSTGLGGGGSYAIGAVSGGSPDFSQVFDVSGFIPGRLRAVLDFYVKNQNSDSGDTIQVDLESFPVGIGAALNTATYGPTAPSTTQWTRQTLDITTLSTSTGRLRARVRQTISGELDSQADSSITEMCLRLGQFTNQLLLNPDFETGLTSWSSVSGTFTVSTTSPLYSGAQYVKGDAAADSEYRQDIAVSAIVGYEIGATVVCEFAMMNNTIGLGTGNVTVECRDGAGVLASVTTGNINVGTTWVRKRLAVDVPAGTTTIRVRMISTRTSATASACFDAFDLRVHKHLDPDRVSEATFDKPVATYMPTSIEVWEARHTIAAPNLCMWAGDSLEGKLGVEPDLETTAAVTGQRFVGFYDGEKMYADAWEFPIGSSGTISTGGNVTFANFGKDNAFTLVLALRFARKVTGRTTIVQRYGSTGWQFGVEDDGTPWALVHGTAAVEAFHSTPIDEGEPVLVAMVHDPATDQLRLITPYGTHTVSTTAAGEFKNNNAVQFTINNIPGMQIARIYGWKSVIATADLQAWMDKFGSDPSGGGLMNSSGRLATAACVVGTDANGVLVGRFGTTDVAIGYNAALAADGGTGYGLVVNGTATNLAKSSEVSDTTNWTRPGGGAATEVSGPEGFRTALRIVGASSVSLQLQNVTVSGADPDVFVVWFARLPAGEASHTAQVKLTSSAGVVKATHTYTPTSQWQMFSHRFTSWDGSTATCRLSFHSSADATSRQVEIAGPVFVDQVGTLPAMIPITRGSATATVNEPSLQALDMSAYGRQINIEGELVVKGIALEASPGARLLATIWNDNDDLDRRTLEISSTHQAVLRHFDGAGVEVASETTAQTWNTLWTVRGRWCRAGLIEAANAFAGVVFGDDTGDPADYDRTTAWTAGTSGQAHVGLGDSAATGEQAALNGLIRSIRVSARESRLPPP